MKLMLLALALLSPVVAAAQTAPVIRDIASGSNFTLVVKADGTVVGWGRDPDGQAARPVSANRVVPAPVTIDLPGKVLQGVTTEVIFKEAPAKAPGLELLVAYRRDSQSEVLRSFLAVVREVVAR